MKKFVLLIVSLAVGISLTGSSVSAQAPPKPKKKMVTRAAPFIPKPKVEDEIWKEFNTADSVLRILFPKVPEISVKGEYERNFGGEPLPCEVTTIQTYINENFYLVNIRRYPNDFLAKREDLAQNFGAWLKTFILRGVQIKSETTRSYGHYKMVEFVYQQTSGEVVIHRAVVIGDRLFQLMLQLNIPKPLTVEQAIEKNQERINKFFDSLQVTEDTVDSRNVGRLTRY